MEQQQYRDNSAAPPPPSGGGQPSLPPPNQEGLDDLQFVTSVNGVEQEPPSHGAMSSSVDVRQQQDATRSMLADSSHPVACIFHGLFKSGALALYIFGGWFTSGHTNFIVVTVFCTLLLAADFWVVKNVTGRLLVGLRWWNMVEPDGTTRWIFESAPSEEEGSSSAPRNKFDSTVFWTVLYVTPLIWLSLFFVGLLRFELGWLLTVCMALSLSFANLYGYWKCSSDQKEKFRNMMMRGAEQGMMAAVRHNVLGMLRGGGGSSATAGGGGQGVPSNTFV